MCALISCLSTYSAVLRGVISGCFDTHAALHIYNVKHSICSVTPIT